MSLFRTSLLLLALSCVAMTQLSAQSPAALAENLKVREARVNILRDEIKNIDLRIEERLSIVLDQLASVVDSRESMSRVAAMKQRTAEALGRAVTEYRRRRATLVEDIRRPALGLTTKQIEEIIRVLDLKTEKRVEEILKLQRSIPTTEIVRPSTENLEPQYVFSMSVPPCARTSASISVPTRCVRGWRANFVKAFRASIARTAP